MAAMANVLSPSLSVHLSHRPRPYKLGFPNNNHHPSRTLSFFRPPLPRFQKFIKAQPLSTQSHQSPPPEPSPTTFSQKAAVFLVTSLLLLLPGRFGQKPALALATEPPKTHSSEKDEATFEKILERSPDDVEALKAVLYEKMRKGRTAEAVKYVERLIAIEPEEVEWRLLQALSFELMGQLGKAKRLFREILKERPLLLRALHGLALAMHKNREGPAVFDMLNKALELARRENRVTEERNIRILIAQMHVVKGDLEGALKQFEDLVNENPRDFRPYLCQGIVYSLLDKKKEADEQFEIYSNLVPDELPQRGFINDTILAAKTETQERLEKDFQSEFSYRR
ncbi:protein SLOW GREEN 1, chloroplastic [Iris pallida]|uniref:Protein SLOW GREEN 1, chloroplastic n=1 Tax=Iris pallida TaxID=29817 RepID=A0AAX6GY75_IRIPA|nr:protein SLOW GREEN 1, chloroplastic [Iris pallida]